ncbi:MAG: biotin--[acetyl-CoA-carboxylase] ligase [Pseudomonadota bacterium]|nr:biotin--[acetyl-CoA-carboxylase] ligase [Pseudomonadota bacterium]
MPSGLKRIHLDETESTNDICLNELNNSDIPILVTADMQTKGRGRNEKEWNSPKGNLYFSFGFTRHNLINGLSVKVGLILAESLQQILKKNVLLKWPNDIFYLNKKVGGILVETSSINNIFKIVIGIGINLQLSDSNKQWGNLEINTDIDKVKEQIIEMLSSKLFVFLEDDLDEDWSKRWTNLCIHNEKEIMLESNNEELIFMGINHDGQLIGKKKDDKIFFVNESSISF